MLPHSSEASLDDDADKRARATFALVIEKALAVDETASSVAADPRTCPNCGAPQDSTRSPYCGERCREESAFVRQVRSLLKSGAPIEQERLASLGQVLWHALGGGYPRRLLLLDEKARLRAFKKSEGKCEACGAPAETFDHIGSACNRGSNLRPMCRKCAVTKDFGSQEHLTRPEVQEQLARLARRIGADQPIRCCDDAESWDWRAYIAERRSLL